jgi:hypothetical protein
MEHMQHPTAPCSADVGLASDHHDLVIELHGMKVTLTRSVRLFAEAAIIPGVLFAGLLHLTGLDWAIFATLGWMYLVLGLRWWRQGRCPGTLVLAAGMFHGRAAVALATASAAVYLLQPIAGSAVMAVLFLGSAFLGRPITVRLARDFVHVPAHVLARDNVQRMFTRVALVWGLSRVIDATVTVFMFMSSTQAGLMSRSLFSPALTVLSIGACTALGVRALRRDGVTFRHVPLPVAAPVLA